MTGMPPPPEPGLRTGGSGLTTTGCVALLALITGTISHFVCTLVELQGQPSWVAALTPLSVDG